MTRRLVFKIWITYFIALFLSVITLFFLVDLSFKRDFNRYASNQAMASLARLEYSVVEFRERNGSLAPLAQDPKLWVQLKNRAFDVRGRASDGPNTNRRRRGRRHSATNHYRQFIKRLILADTNKQIIAGRERIKADYSWYPIKSSQQTLGYFGYIEPKNLLRSIDHAFIHKQAKRLSIICAASLLLSLIVAAIIARRISTPIKNLSRATQKLTTGDFSVRVNPVSDDEIGNLCNNVNTLAQTLAANQQMRNQWVADISHEMRTPVSVLRAQIEAMQDGIREPTDKNLNLLHTSVTNLASLIDDLFELSLADLGALNYNKETVALADFLQDFIDSVKPKIEASGLSLNTQIDIDPKLTILADKKRLHQVFENLLENSIRYTHSPGQISIACHSNSKFINLCFEDSAPGVAGDKHKRIFDRLFRVEVSRSRDTGGAGLGLAICKNIVEAHQGEIWAQQSPLGGLAIQLKLLVNYE